MSYIFTQFLDLLPRYEFQKIVNKYNGDYKVRNFNCWNQLACMIYGQLKGEKSLREIDRSINSQLSKLYHIGIKECPKSTLGDANEKRDFRIYEEFAKYLMVITQNEYKNTDLSLDITSAVYALDASTVDLCLNLFDWAKFRRRKGAVKLHTMIDLKGNIPVFLNITDGKTHDIKAVGELPIEANAIYVMDRGYVDFSWLMKFNQASCFFVTRLKTNINYRRICSNSIDHNVGIKSDQEIKLVSNRLKERYPLNLRRVSFHDGITKKNLVFLTNNFNLPAIIIADIYKARWQIELFFKWIKQNLKIKTFYGYSQNAVKTQLWIAMIVYLLISLIKERYKVDMAPSAMLHLIDANLFENKPLLLLFLKATKQTKNKTKIEQLNLFDFLS